MCELHIESVKVLLNHRTVYLLRFVSYKLRK